MAQAPADGQAPSREEFESGGPRRVSHADRPRRPYDSPLDQLTYGTYGYDDDFRGIYADRYQRRYRYRRAALNQAVWRKETKGRNERNERETKGNERTCNAS